MTDRFPPRPVIRSAASAQQAVALQTNGRRGDFWSMLAVLVGSFFWVPQCASAQPAISQHFDGPDTVWELLESGVPAKILAHDCVAGGARDNSSCERIVVAGPAGQSVQLICPIERVGALDELQVHLWVKSDRPNVQLAARVRLPRSIDPKSREAVSVIVRGAEYRQPGHWQQLLLSDVPKLVAAQVRVMRVTGVAIDPRESFVDAIVLVVPGDSAAVEVASDELEVEGVLLSATSKSSVATSQSAVASAPSTAATSAAPTGNEQRDEAANSVAGAPARSPVRLSGGTLTVDDRPFLPRIIQWRGEPLRFLAERGFNVVQLPGPPSSAQIGDAQRYGLWFLCSAPRPDALAQTTIGQAGDRVLGWYLEDEALEVDPQYARRWADLVRERDAIYGRLVIMAPLAEWRSASKSADVLVASHPRMGRLSAANFDGWMESRASLSMPGEVIWPCVSTQFGEAANQQIALLGGESQPPPSVPLKQLKPSIALACARGTRGILFQSTTMLSASDAVTRQRAHALESINRRLALIEPWLAGGKMVGRIASADATWTGVVFYVDRAKLVIPVPAVHDATNSAANEIEHRISPSTEIALVIPGIPESSQVLLLSPAMLRTLPTQRVAGGTRIVVPPSSGGMILVTEDPQVLVSLRQHIARHGVGFVRVERELAVQQSRSIKASMPRLTQVGNSHAADSRELNAIDMRLAQCESLLAAGRIEQASQIVATADQSLERLAATQKGVVESAGSHFESNPLTIGTDGMGSVRALKDSFDSQRTSENLLYGGDFEDLNRMTGVGWQHVSRSLPGLATRAQLAAGQVQQGNLCLQLTCTIVDAMKSVEPLPAAAVWIMSPAMPVEQGQVIEITGWVRVNELIAGGEGLQIVDSIGGAELSLVVGRTNGWQPFRMIRSVPRSTELRITFALDGVGSAKIDGVMVRALQRPMARRLPSVSPRVSATANEANDVAGPLLVVPPGR